jgi:hypothetical protein
MLQASQMCQNSCRSLRGVQDILVRSACSKRGLTKINHFLKNKTSTSDLNTKALGLTGQISYFRTGLQNLIISVGGTLVII